jgi:hypothetical protein
VSQRQPTLHVGPIRQCNVCPDRVAKPLDADDYQRIAGRILTKLADAHDEVAACCRGAFPVARSHACGPARILLEQMSAARLLRGWIARVHSNQGNEGEEGL